MPSTKMTEQDREEFALYLKACTDNQVHGVFEKETAANRKVYADMALEELESRRLSQKTNPPL